MSDLRVIWDSANARGEWAPDSAALLGADDLVTAVLVSIFTDRVAHADDTIPDGSTDRRGWWGDTGEDVPIGSRLWLISRAKQTTATLAAAQTYIQEALQWLIDDGVVARFTITTEWTRRGMLGAQIVAYKTSGATTAINFLAAWNGL